MVGDRWALLVVRELLLGPKRFTDLRAGLPGVGPDVLAQRLRDLEAAGVVERRVLAPPAGARGPDAPAPGRAPARRGGAGVYDVTARGRALEPVILALGRWGSVAPFPSGEAVMGPDA